MTSKKNYRYGEVIRQHRVKLGLTQRQVADQCGITDSALAHYEREMRLPSEPVAAAIARALRFPKEVCAKFHAELKAVREQQTRDRVKNRGGSVFTPIRGAGDLPDAKALAGELADDPELLKACRNLQKALSKRSQRKAVIRALEAWASED